MSAKENPSGGTTKEPTLSKEDAQATIKEHQTLLQEEKQREKKLDEANRVLAEYRKKQRKDDPQISAADKKILNYAGAAAGAAALVPLPMMDLAAIGAIQFKMLSDLAKIFNVPISEQSGKAAIGSLAGSFGAGPLMSGAALSLFKFVPILGQAAGLLALPAAAFASTYAVGKVFAPHFASGGNLLNLDIVAAKAAYKRYADEGKGLAPA